MGENITESLLALTQRLDGAEDNSNGDEDSLGDNYLGNEDEIGN